jgi:NhaP-type Na+/H+ or K+/H+ antiporter
MKKGNKALRVILFILFAVLLGNVMRTGGLSDVRTVDFLQILSAGAMLGVFITLLFSRTKQ